MTSPIPTTSVPPHGGSDRGHPRHEGETTPDGGPAKAAAAFADAAPPSLVHPIRILDDLISALAVERQNGDEQTPETQKGRENGPPDGDDTSVREGGGDDMSSPLDPDHPRPEEGDPSRELSTLPRRGAHEHDDDSGQSQERRLRREYRVDTILRAADFLLSPEAHGSLLESAIAVLDSSSSSVSSPPPVRRVIASPSGRVAYFVRGGSSSSSSAWSSAKRRRTGGGGTDGGGGGPATPCLSSSPGPSPPPRPSSSRSTTEYVCLLGEYVTPAEVGGGARGEEDGRARLRSYHANADDDDGGGERRGGGGGSGSGSGRRSPYESYYCTCRSFYEKFKRAYGPEASSGGNAAVVLCKHLLAAKLAPHLLGEDFCEVVVSEETFALWMVQSCCC